MSQNYQKHKLSLEVVEDYNQIGIIIKRNSPEDISEKAGIKAGDYIVRINKEQVQGKTLMEAVKLMRGQSVQENCIRRKDVKKSLTFNIQRQIIDKIFRSKIYIIKILDT